MPSWYMEVGFLCVRQNKYIYVYMYMYKHNTYAWKNNVSSFTMNDDGVSSVCASVGNGKGVSEW